MSNIEANIQWCEKMATEFDDTANRIAGDAERARDAAMSLEKGAAELQGDSKGELRVVKTAEYYKEKEQQLREDAAYWREKASQLRRLADELGRPDSPRF
jgi:hypothetical protein